MARAFWKGSISFGMVVIPVQLVVATRERPLSFHVLHKKCLTRPRQVWFCDKDEVYFGNEDTVRGYEYAKGQFITLDENDFSRVPVKTEHVIEIDGFTESAAVDAIYYHNGYYVQPGEHGLKPYALLRRVLADAGRVAIAKVTLQKRENVCILRPTADLLTLHTLFYADEVRPADDAGVSGVALGKKELDIAKRLVDSMGREFKIDSYRDEYHTALEKVIQAKLKGKQIEKPPERVLEPNADLLAALKASVAARKREKAPAK